MTPALNTFFWLLWRDVRALRKTFFNQWLDYSFLLGIVTSLNNYVMTTFGMPANYGVHMLISQSTSSMAWSLFNDIGAIAYDLSGPKTVSYELTLPTSYRLVYCKTVLAGTIKGLLLTLAALPIGALFIFKSISFAQICWYKLVLAFVLSAFLFGFFIMFTAMLCKNAEGFNRFWMRWGMIIWMFSGQFTPWAIMYKAANWAGYVTLFNPFVYAFEAAHAAFMGQTEFLNFWLCCASLLVFCTLFAYWGMYLFKKKLDCV